MEDFYPRTGTPCSGFHPGFFVDHATAACRFEGRAPHLTVELIKDAIENLVILKDTPDSKDLSLVETLLRDEF